MTRYGRKPYGSFLMLEPSEEIVIRDYVKSMPPQSESEPEPDPPAVELNVEVDLNV